MGFVLVLLLFARCDCWFWVFWVFVVLFYAICWFGVSGEFVVVIVWCRVEVLWFIFRWVLLGVVISGIVGFNDLLLVSVFLLLKLANFAVCWVWCLAFDLVCCFWTWSCGVWVGISRDFLWFWCSGRNFLVCGFSGFADFTVFVYLGFGVWWFGTSGETLRFFELT